ncbi:hypothetical protein A2159_00030 [Candidatus Woesebacteria bacterium RBG_13_34_9]|uniref:Small ribosomal subunit protein bS20 n=1 Tax=Candidatus Woesebacteria bacterium RBG_13_34_9 TaxID=1802477 RepID=A0A1F7X3F0_9BACT|nr:MAG: hypothetical protein A2159_00030 [Candidatus Woesebacteria bacterium RBG_13_34_9]
MPVTKTAKRALRSAKKKFIFNKRYLSRLEISVRLAKKSRKQDKIKEALSLIDRAVNKNIIHKNKAARIKSTLSKLFPKVKPSMKLKTQKGKAQTKRQSASSRKK